MSARLLADRVCLITGATRGIGFHVALGLARQGARLLLVARDEARGRSSARAIEAVTGSRTIELCLADLSSQRSIRRLADEIHHRHDRLNVLVNCAGARFARRQLTVDGLEQTLALNHLGRFLFTGLVIDLLRSGAPARIINVASRAHALGRVDFEDLELERNYRGRAAYRASQLESLYFTYELARRLEGTRVTVNAVHPGSPIWGQGAAAAIRLATAPELERVSGRYFVGGQPARSSPRSYDRAAQACLWALSRHLTAQR